MPVKKKATYEDLKNVPDTMIGEIIDGELYTAPRPSKKHVNATTALGGEIWGPYQIGRGGGPGGWWILIEPEVQLGEDTVVPDLAGWKKERLATLGEGNQIGLAPDWVCEVLSPGTVRVDKAKKTPLYARFSVQFLWLLDPIAKTLEVFRLESGKWLMISVHSEDEKIRVEPFQEIEIELKNLFAD